MLFAADDDARGELAATSQIDDRWAAAAGVDKHALPRGGWRKAARGRADMVPRKAGAKSKPCSVAASVDARARHTRAVVAAPNQHAGTLAS